MKIKMMMRLILTLTLMLASTTVYGEETTGVGLMDRIALSGLIEAEFAHESSDEENTSDLVLATVELGADVDIAKHHRHASFSLRGR